MSKEIKYSDAILHQFSKTLLHWHETQNFRSYPWKKEKDPYKIWLSEVILQQTRSEQGLPYYNRFIAAFPTIIDLANADDDSVFKLWQGLGYYNRCRNLLFTARFIKDQYNGVFPKNYNDISALKGVGAYTAAAIASFAYNLPYAVVDGNVYRVLSRYFGIDTPIDSTIGKKEFAHLSQSLIPVEQPSSYNQAIMDFGATVCTPKQPLCASCLFSNRCIAYRQEMTTLLPVKSKKLVIKERYFNYFLLQHGAKIYIEQRDDKDIWANLYQPLLIEGNIDSCLEKLLANGISVTNTQMEMVYQTKQRLTHQLIHFTFFKIDLVHIPNGLDARNFMNIKKLRNLAFPKTIISFFDNKSYF